MEHTGEHKLQPVHQKCIMFANTTCKPFNRNASCLGTQNASRSAEMHRAWEHKMQTVHQKCRALGQPSRIPKASMWYDNDIVAGRGLTEVDDFDVVGGAAVEADTDLG